MPTCKCSLLDEIDDARSAVTGLECANRLLRMRNDDQAAELVRFKAFFSANADELAAALIAEKELVFDLRQALDVSQSETEIETDAANTYRDRCAKLDRLQCPHKPTCSIAKITGVTP